MVENKEKIQLASDVIKFIERTIKTHHMYQGKHPNLQTFRQEVLNSLRKYHQKYDEDLVLNLKSAGYEFENTIIYEEENISNSNVYYLYKMGVRTIVFTLNTDVNELNKFIDILIYRKSEANDIITLLWEADFKTILYNKVETFYESTTEQKESFSQFSNWIRKKEAPVQKNYEAFGFDFSKKKKKYRASDIKKEIKIEDNEQLFEELKEKNKIELLESDVEFIHNNLKFDMKELPQRWSSMITKISFMYPEKWEEYIEYIYKYLDNYIKDSEYKSIYFLFYEFKTAYETSINKKKVAPLLKGLYKELIAPERLKKIAVALSNMTEENYFDFVLFFKELNHGILVKFVDNFVNIENKQLRENLIQELEAMNFDLTSYYKQMINSSSVENILEGLEGIRKSNKIPINEKLALYKTATEFRRPEIDLYLLDLFQGYYEDDLYMSNFILRLLKSKDMNILTKVIAYIATVNNEALFLKATKFIETSDFLAWKTELKKDYLGILVQRLGISAKNYLLALFNSKALKNKKGFDSLRVAIVYSFSFLLDEEIVVFLKSLSKKLMLSKQIKEEAQQSLIRMQQIIAAKQRK